MMHEIVSTFKLASAEKESTSDIDAGRTPRISKMIALASHLQELVDSGKVADYAELARAGFVSRARVTQIMNLTLLAPDIQEAVLFLPQIPSGRDPLSERKLRQVPHVSIHQCSNASPKKLTDTSFPVR